MAREMLATFDIGLGGLVKREGAVFDLACSLVCGDHDSGAGGLGVDKIQPGGDGPIGEEALACTEQNGEYPDPELVDEVVCHQRLDEIAAAVDLNLRAGLVLESGDFLADVTLDQR